MPSTKRRHEYTFRNTTTREDFVGEASEANESNTTPDEAREPSDTLFPNLEGGKGHDDVAGRRRSKSNPIHLNPGPKGLGPTTRHHATDPCPRRPGRRQSILVVARLDRGEVTKTPSDHGRLRPPLARATWSSAAPVGIFSESYVSLRCTLLQKFKQIRNLSGKFK